MAFCKTQVQRKYSAVESPERERDLSFIAVMAQLFCAVPVVVYLDICIGLCHPLIVPCMWNSMKVFTHEREIEREGERAEK